MADKLPTVLSQTPIAFAGDAAGKEPFFKLEHWVVEDDKGQESDRIVWCRGNFVTVVAVTPEKQIVTIREYKQAAKKVFLGLVAGTLKKNESLLQTVLRELRDEAGYSATEADCTCIGDYAESPDKTTAGQYIVLVENAVCIGEPSPEGDETILGVQLMDFKSALDGINIVLHRLALYEVERHSHAQRINIFGGH